MTTLIAAIFLLAQPPGAPERAALTAEGGGPPIVRINFFRLSNGNVYPYRPSQPVNVFLGDQPQADMHKHCRGQSLQPDRNGLLECRLPCAEDPGDVDPFNISTYRFEAPAQPSYSSVAIKYRGSDEARSRRQDPVYQLEHSSDLSQCHLANSEAESVTITYGDASSLETLQAGLTEFNAAFIEGDAAAAAAFNARSMQEQSLTVQFAALSDNGQINQAASRLQMLAAAPDASPVWRQSRDIITENVIYTIPVLLGDETAPAMGIGADNSVDRLADVFSNDGFTEAAGSDPELAAIVRRTQDAAYLIVTDRIDPAAADLSSMRSEEALREASAALDAALARAQGDAPSDGFHR